MALLADAVLASKSDSIVRSSASVGAAMATLRPQAFDRNHGGNSVAVVAFKALRHRSLDGRGRVFVNMQGEPLHGYKHWFDRAVSEAGIKDFTLYCLRHTFASRLVMAGVDLRTVAELVGHQTIQMTMRYAHLGPAHTVAAVECLFGAGSLRRKKPRP